MKKQEKDNQGKEKAGKEKAGKEKAGKEKAAAPQLAYVSVAEAALLLGIHRSAVYQAIRSGQLQAVRVMGKKALHRADVMAYTPRPYKGRSPEAEKTL